MVSMARTEVAAATDRYLAALDVALPGRVVAVYAVGSLALDDFSARQSNFDLVVVGDPRLTPAEVAQSDAAARSLRRAGRPAQVWHVSWEDLDAEGPGLDGGETGPILATPMTRAILRHDPMVLKGPEWPVVAYDPQQLRLWSRRRLQAMTDRPGLLLLRRYVSPFVLETARLAQAVITGRVLSKSEAGETLKASVSSRHQKLLTDSVGYRHGAQTSMYWGPFERKYDVLTLVRELLAAATSP
jgi:hypothetical protein